MRVKFQKTKQREFIKKVLEVTDCPSLRSLIQRGINVPYPTLKSYFQERRFLPQELFNDLCLISKINPEEFTTKILNENWGQSKGGKSK